MNSYKVPVIYYHSIGPLNKDWYRNFLTIEPSVFENHLEFFSKRFRVISLKEYYLIRTGQITSVKDPLIITFDDGYLDNFIWAYPLLKKYGLKATIFISPEFVDQKNGIRSEKNMLGFLSWNELKILTGSEWVDIQSHTMTHTKYFSSDRIIDFHNPRADYLYPIGNLFPSEKSNYIGNKIFKKLIPYGSPFFEEASSVITRRIKINPDFINVCIELLKNYDFSHYDFNEAFKIVKPVYDDYKAKDKLIVDQETEKDYNDRIIYEIIGSKKIIEEKLHKKVEFLCWPHGDNNEFLHRMALDGGYLMTTTGKARGIKETDITRIPERIGVDFSTWYRKQKTILKIKALSGKSPYSEVLKVKRYFIK